MTKRLFISIVLMLIVGLSYSQSADDFAKSIYGRNPKAGHYAKINGFNMYYETYGEGEPLLIIHGNGGSINNFIYQIPYFAKHYKVIVADSRAQGKSIDTGDSLSYEMMADDLNALLDSLHINSCDVIGWSDGGINGLLLAIRHPEKVKKLAITGANLWPDASAVDSKVIDYVVKQQDSLSKLSPTAETKHAKKLMNLLINEPHISLEQLNTIKCPTLVIGGDHDVILPIHTLLIAQSIPKSYLWIIPNSGHSTPIFYKDQFNKTIYDFFEKPFRTIDGLDRFN
ncbi:alpha/beta fold hydrolase [Flavobacterium sp. N3904]|uniref:alpha/beta fold hydrolase n=1 Tax=Flavobacterium sp. N3904 TaxID=2986835 RepID=UPI0022258326|nr:alpha/beta hydrolase [Flavobacterium sp. N3904]